MAIKKINLYFYERAEQSVINLRFSKAMILLFEISMKLGSVCRVERRCIGKQVH